MAVEISNKQLVASYQNFFGNFYPLKNDTIFKKIIIKILQFLFPLIVKILNSKRLFLSKLKKIYFDQNIKSKKIEINLNQSSRNFLNNNGWCFIENFLDDNTYNSIYNYWPDENHFLLGSKLVKYYYTAFKSVKKSKPKNIEKFYYLNNFYDYICSEQFDFQMSNFLSNNDDKYKCYSILSSICKKNNFLAPHRDGIAKKNLDKKVFNFIYFIDGNNSIPEFSGATGLFEDNNFEKANFIPKNIKNTCLVYDSSDKFFHGFKALAKNGHRKAITFQFFQDDIYENLNG